MTAERERRLTSTQRRMLRLIVGIGRRKMKYDTNGVASKIAQSDCSDDSTVKDSECDVSDSPSVTEEEEIENFVDWIRRATHISEKHF